MTDKIILRGCAPEPLIHYLKALGVLRLVVEGKFDVNARGAWTGDSFALQTMKTAEDLVRFFLNDYRPTPLVAPWNNGSGFHADEEASGKGKKFSTLPNIKNSTHPRLRSYRETIREAELLLAECMTPEIAKLESKKRPEVLKPVLVPLCRNRLSDEVVRWLDAVCVITDKKSRTPRLLGSGGNDGNLEFSLTFMERIAEVLPLREEEQTTSKSEQQLHAALFGMGKAKGSAFSPGQFQPAGTGGENATSGITAKFYANPWDYVLAVEGTLMLAGAAVRRLAARAATASFPFWVRSVRMDAGIAPNEKALGELFLPLWERFASYGEVAHLFGEGRIQLGTRQAGDTIEAARAIAALGVDRGIARFHRHALLTRKGKMQFAASLGSIEVKPRQPKVIEIVESFLTLDSWIWKFRQICDSDKAPATFSALRRAIDSALFRYCAEGKPEHLLSLIIELGRAEAEIALRPGLRKTDKWELQPLPTLATGWANEADDASPEFAIAVALASINNRVPKTLANKDAVVPADSTKKPQGDGDEAEERSSLRSSLEPVLFRKRNFVWAESNASASAVWSNRPFAENLAAVLHRRAIEARMENFAHPAISAARATTLDSIALFLDKQLDERRIENLVRGMSLLDWRGTEAELAEKYKAQEYETPVRLPRAYALLKMLFLPNGKLSFSPDREPYLIKHEPRIVPLLMANRIGDALAIAAQRLHATGLVPLTNAFHFPSYNGARLAAALLIPINQRTIRRLARLVLREPEEEV